MTLYIQSVYEREGFQTVKQLRLRDFVFNGNKIYDIDLIPEDFYLKLMVKYF